jgi:hypothetical protein
MGAVNLCGSTVLRRILATNIVYMVDLNGTGQWQMARFCNKCYEASVVIKAGRF